MEIKVKMPYFCAKQHMQKVSIFLGFFEHITVKKRPIFQHTGEWG